MRSMTQLIIVFFIAQTLLGCAAAQLAVPLVLEGARVANQSSQNKYKHVEIVYRPGYSYESVSDIESTAFLVKGSGTDFFAPGSGTTLSDNLAKEFLVNGMNVEEHTTLETLVTKNKMGVDTTSVLTAAEIANIEAVFQGSVETGHDYSMGFLGVGGGMKQGITGATLKLIDVKTKKVMLIMSVNYKKPKASRDVAADLTGAFFTQEKANQG